EPLHERRSLRIERAHLGADLRRETIDRDEQCELTGVQRVEDLPVVAARPDVATVGDEPQVDQVVARLAQPPHGCVHARRRQPGVEKRPYDPQRHEIAKRVLGRTAGFAGSRLHETASRPVAELRDRASRESRRLRGGVAHAGLRIVATAEALAPGTTLLPEDAAQPTAGAQPPRERLQPGPTQL